MCLPFCVKCGHELPAVAAFCPNCGAPVLQPTSQKSVEDSGLTLAEAFAACEARKYDEARKAYRALTRSNSSLSVAWYNLGVTEFRAMNFVAAVDAFEHVLKLKEQIVVGAYAKILCHNKLGRPIDIPPEYANNPGVIGVEGPARNLMHELQNRGYAVVIEPKGEDCKLETRVGQVTYTITINDFFGRVLCNLYREESGEKVIMLLDYPNPTATDKEFMALVRETLTLRLAQMPV